MVGWAEMTIMGAANVIGTIGVMAISIISVCCTSPGIGMAATSFVGQALPRRVVRR